MKTKLLAGIAAFLLLEASGFAHRLDEYLQATIISLEKNRVDVFMRLIPGVAVSSSVIVSIDTNADGVISSTERQIYAERVLRDLSLSVDGKSLKPRLMSVDFPKTDEMKEGLGEIQIEFNADLPSGGSNRKIVFENHHQGRISAYLVNCLVPRDKHLQITAQTRNNNQSFYQLDYTEADDSLNRFSLRWLSGLGAVLGVIALLLLAGLASLWRRHGPRLRQAD
jgi:hypothetical protein